MSSLAQCVCAFLLSLPLFLLLLLPLNQPSPASAFTERIGVFLFWPNENARRRPITSDLTKMVDEELEDNPTTFTQNAQQARRDFVSAMGPQRMAELREVRQHLVAMQERLISRWNGSGLLQPGALLAHSMALARQREANRRDRRLDPGSRGVSKLNRPIHDFLFQSDILLSANESRAMLDQLIAEDEEKRDSSSKRVIVIEEDEDQDEGDILVGKQIGLQKRRKRQAQTGRNFPTNQWEPGRPIPYFFDQKLGRQARRAVRLAVEFWTEHTCLSFAENGRGFPRVKVFSGGGCYSQVGRAYRQPEQIVSLGRGCEQFGIAAHELGHTMGFFHGQARADRDQFINVVYSNLSPQLATQFAKLSPEDNFNFGVTYDYGSIMHYSDTDSATSRVTMLAREKIYQHTMGNNVEPSFLDVLEMNLYYKCGNRCAKRGAECQNGGYRHPRNCSSCLCPSGFGEFDCSGRAPAKDGAPEDCGADIQASEGQLQTLEGAVSAAKPTGLADKHAQCWWHIRAPAGKRVQLRVKSISGACSDGCFYGGIEIKTKEFVRVGARVCCRSDMRPLGLLYSQTELAIVGLFSQYKKQKFVMEYRAVDPKAVPNSLIGEYDDLEAVHGRRSTSTGAVRKGGGEGGGGRKGSGKGRNAEVTEPGGQDGGGRQPPAECRDVAGNCFSLLHLCENLIYRTLMGRQCAKSCLQCDGGEKSGASGTDCSGRDHASCPTWANNGFCHSRAYSRQVKQQICPRECKFC